MHGHVKQWKNALNVWCVTPTSWFVCCARRWIVRQIKSTKSSNTTAVRRCVIWKARIHIDWIGERIIKAIHEPNAQIYWNLYHLQLLFFFFSIAFANTFFSAFCQALLITWNSIRSTKCRRRDEMRSIRSIFNSLVSILNWKKKKSKEK